LSLPADGGAATLAVMRSLALAAIGCACAAQAAERRPFVSSFDRVRVEGPYRVVVTSGRSPAGRVTGDARQLDQVEVRQDGRTVYVRRRGGIAGPLPLPAPAQPVVVTLTAPTLTAAYLVGNGALEVTGMKGPRLDLSVTGGGTIQAAGANGAELNATTIGAGRITIAGRVDRARLLVNGAGGVNADALDTGELTVRLDGPGEVAARARFTANLVSTGLGRVVVAGSPKCQVRAPAGGAVLCGVRSAPARSDGPSTPPA
jgi:hypothetical protein